MLKQLRWISLVLCFSTSLVFAVAPANLAADKELLMTYQASGQYDHEISAVIAEAKSYLEKRIKENNASKTPKKLAIVLDIDETALSNYPDMVTLNFGGTLEDINNKENIGHDPAIYATLQLYQYAKNNGVAVFFLTGRPNSMKEATIKNLSTVGYSNWDDIIFRTPEEMKLGAIPYKTKHRQEISNQGYDIVLSIGDQESDLKGGYADKTYLLPNPFYSIP